MKNRGLGFNGLVKTATRGFCMEKLSEIELVRMGMWKGYFALNNEKKLGKFFFVWVDRDWRYFISNTSSLKPGMPYARDKLIQVDYIPNADTVCVEFEINQPRVAESYYSINSNIDESNRTRQDDFQFERKLQTKYWSIRVNTSILGINDVDNYYIGKACKWWDKSNPSYFYYNTAEYIIDNWWT